MSDSFDALRKARAKRNASGAFGEDALALEFARRYEGRFCFDHSRGEWFRWSGLRWVPDTVQYCFDCCRAIMRETRNSKIRTATAIERAARADPRLAVDHTAWNSDPFVLGTPSGAVDLHTGENLPANPKLMITMATSIDPAEPGTPCPIWDAFLNEATGGDAALKRYLMRRCAYWLTGDVSFEDFDFIYGPGGAGKGTFIKTVTSIVGDYAVSAPGDMFMSRRHEGHPTEIARLRNARLVICSEIEQGEAWALTKLKILTGNEAKLSARFMHQNYFEFWPQFKLCFTGNHKPKIKTVDKALLRRFRLVPFNCPPAKPDPDLKHRLEVEYPAILRRMIESRAADMVVPDTVRIATNEYLGSEDLIGRFVIEQCERSGGCLLAELYRKWCDWCAAEAIKPTGKTTFNKDLQEWSRDHDRKEGRIWQAPKEQGTWLWNLSLKN